MIKFPVQTSRSSVLKMVISIILLGVIGVLVYLNLGEVDLKLQLTLSPIQFRLSQNDDWKNSAPKHLISEIVELQFITEIELNYLAQEGYLDKTAITKINNRKNELSGKLRNLSVRVPVRIQVSNLGRRDAKISQGEIRLFGYSSKEPLSFILKSRPFKVSENQTRILSISSIDFGGGPGKQAVLAYHLDKNTVNESFITLTKNNSDWNDMASKLLRMSFSQIEKFEREPLKIEVQFIDQFGNGVSDEATVKETYSDPGMTK